MQNRCPIAMKQILASLLLLAWFFSLGAAPSHCRECKSCSGCCCPPPASQGCATLAPVGCTPAQVTAQPSAVMSGSDFSICALQDAEWTESWSIPVDPQSHRSTASLSSAVTSTPRNSSVILQI